MNESTTREHEAFLAWVKDKAFDDSMDAAWEAWKARAAAPPAQAVEPAGWYTGPVHPTPEQMREAWLADAVQPARELSDAEILEIRDSLLPSQGESFDCIAFARAIRSRT